MIDINVLRRDYETQVARANHLEQRLKEVLKENAELRTQLVDLRNHRTIFIDRDEEYELPKKEVKCKIKKNMNLL